MCASLCCTPNLLLCNQAASIWIWHDSVCCRCVYSGSWDYTVRVWHRNSLDLAGIVPFDDWVFSLASRGQHLLAGASSRLHILDIATLKPLRTLWHQVRPIGFPALHYSFASLKLSSMSANPSPAAWLPARLLLFSRAKIATCCEP